MVFEHQALDLKGNKTLVYTAMSKHLFYYRMQISKYVLECDKVPLNPFMLFDYFLLDAVDRDKVREANNSIVLAASEIWVFGPVSNGVLSEILIAQKASKEIRYFALHKPHKIEPIAASEIQMEEEVALYRHLIETISSS